MNPTLLPTELPRQRAAKLSVFVLIILVFKRFYFFEMQGQFRCIHETGRILSPSSEKLRTSSIF